MSDVETGNISGQLGLPGSGLHITQSQVTGFGPATYVTGACLGALFAGGIAELVLGVNAERQSLEDIAQPLTAEEADEGSAPQQDRLRTAT